MYWQVTEAHPESCEVQERFDVSIEVIDPREYKGGLRGFLVFSDRWADPYHVVPFEAVLTGRLSRFYVTLPCHHADRFTGHARVVVSFEEDRHHDRAQP